MARRGRYDVGNGARRLGHASKVASTARMGILENHNVEPLPSGGESDLDLGEGPGSGLSRPVSIEARGLEKDFRIPTHRMTTFKERALHLGSGADTRTLHAVSDVSFDVAQGEFFGIVGRNGSGKSTLLKILAGIYRADAGTVRIAGRVAPFIELGVGFNLEFPARENVILNGVMMGLTPKEARNRLDAVIDFAELGEFVDLKLKNYSSGMMVRLAFSAMIQADADVMLIDEVLAVGDASFQRKCLDVFHELRNSNKTVVLVTHDMATVEKFCDRAMLIHDGEIRHIGDPEEVGRRYFRLNFGGVTEKEPERDLSPIDGGALIPDAWIVNGAGERVGTVEQREPIRMRVIIEAREDIFQPGVGFVVTDADGTVVCGLGSPIALDPDKPGRLDPGERIKVEVTLENPLAPGRYFVVCLVTRNAGMNDIVLRVPNVLEFVVYGSVASPGVVSLNSTIEAFSEDDPGGERG